MLNFIIGLLFTIVALVFLEPILYFFGASENTISYACEYMEIILAGNVITHIYFGLNSLLRSAGHPKKAMAATIMTVLLNAILDPLFIFTFDMGIRGAAVATILAQIVALILVVVWFCDKRELIHFERGIFRLEKRIVKDSIVIGLAPFLMNFVQDLRWGPGHRSLRNRQPHIICIHYDCVRSDSGHAAYCRLQLRCPADVPRV